MSPGVLRAMGRLDEERQELCRVLGVNSKSLDEIYDEIGIGPIYRADISPMNEVGSKIYHMEDRFISEDVPYGLVPWSSLGKMFGVQTPGIDATIQLGSMIKGVDYFEEGLNVEGLGIAGLSLDELNRYLNKGDV
jgi:opine dehydrogenase